MKPISTFQGRVNGTTYFRNDASEAYVEIPPALMITASDGKMFTLGTQYIQHGDVFEFNVLVNDVDTGEVASKIVYQRGTVRIFGRDGWRIWTGKGFI